MVDTIGGTVPERVRRKQQIQQWFWLPLLLGAVIYLAWAWLAEASAVFSPIIATDIDQQRANATLPPLQGNVTVRQTFRPRWDGLREIELILVRHEQVEGDGRLHLRLRDPSGHIVAEQDLDTHFVEDNQTYSFLIPVQPNAAGRDYVLEISGNESNPVSVQGYTLDVYAQGELSLATGALDIAEVPPTAVEELRFVTRYQLTWIDAIRALGTIISRQGVLLLLALLFILLPGCLLLLARPASRQWDRMAWWGMAFALGAATWPLLWLWLSLLGGRWWGWLLWVAFAAGWVAVGVLWWRRRGRQSVPDNVPDEESGKWAHGALLLLLLLGLALRLLAVRDLVFPPWVDASRHGLITAVMGASGRIPTGYQPFLAIDRFPYHFGFHTLSTSLHLMAGWPLHTLLLYFGQLLNGLVPLAVYAAGWMLTRRRGLGLLAAFLVAIPFFFPAYYATWGRMTQLTAVLLLPVLLAQTWRLVHGKGGWRSGWWIVGLLAAGLFLVHFRVFLFYLPFAALVWLVSVGRNGRWLVLATALALLLVAPRIVQLVRMTRPVETVATTIPGYNTFPGTYLNVGWEQYFAIVAGATLLLVLLAAIQRRSWATLPLVLAAWVSVLFILLAGERLGLPETWLINTNSMYITLFVPLALFLVVVAGQFWRWLVNLHWLLHVLGYVGLGVGLTAALLFGVRQQITVLNPVTILARSQDLAGLQWLDENLPESATVAVNSWLWLGNTWAVADGGAWLLPLTGRSATTPPADYIYSRSLSEAVTAFNETAETMADWSAPAAARWLRQQGVDYVFIGARGGFLDPAALAANPQVKMIYGRDGVFIFALGSS